jgi:hypothetical protein
MRRSNLRCGTSQTLKRIVAVSALGTVDNARIFPFAETSLYPSASLPNITLYLTNFYNTRIYVQRNRLRVSTVGMLNYGICLSASVLPS